MAQVAGSADLAAYDLTNPGAGDGPAMMAAHAVAHDVEPKDGVHQKAVLVGGAMPPDVRPRRVRHLHGAIISKYLPCPTHFAKSSHVAQANRHHLVRCGEPLLDMPEWRNW